MNLQLLNSFFVVIFVVICIARENEKSHPAIRLKIMREKSIGPSMCARCADVIACEKKRIAWILIMLWWHWNLRDSWEPRSRFDTLLLLLVMFFFGELSRRRLLICQLIAKSDDKRWTWQTNSPAYIKSEWLLLSLSSHVCLPRVTFYKQLLPFGRPIGRSVGRSNESKEKTERSWIIDRVGRHSSMNCRAFLKPRMEK